MPGGPPPGPPAGGGAALSLGAPPGWGSEGGCWAWATLLVDRAASSPAAIRGLRIVGFLFVRTAPRHPPFLTHDP